MQMTALPAPPPQCSDPLWDLAQLPGPEGGQCVIRGGVAWALGWEVTAGSPEQKPRCSARRLGPALTTHQPSGPAPTRPLGSRPGPSSCDLVTWALRDSPAPCSAHCPLLREKLHFCPLCLRAFWELPSDPSGGSVMAPCLLRGQE